MNWKFWVKRQKQEQASHAKAEKLPKPKSIPQLVGTYLVVNMGKDPDWVWKLMGVVRKRKDESRYSYDFRVFDEASAAADRVSIKNYNTLDEHPGFILFEGWFDKKSFEVHINKKEKPPAMPKAA